MSEKDLWDQYCSFFEKDFQEQLKHSRQRLKSHLEKWRKTKTAKKICPNGFDSIDDVPITTYDDYPMLHEFGRRMERLVENDPKPEGMLWRDYYKRKEQKLKPMIEEWIPGEYGGCIKTTGSTGGGKWTVIGEDFMDNIWRDSIVAIVLGCSDGYGSTKIERWDTILNMGVPVPYITGYGLIAMSEEFRVFPPVELLDDMMNMQKKLNYIIRRLQKGQELDFAGAIASTFHLFVKSIVHPDKLYYDYYKSIPFGFKKIMLYLLYLKERLKNRKVRYAKEVLPVKGLTTAGLDTILYADYLKKHFGSYPINVYGSTELGIAFIGTPERRLNLIPNLRTIYPEFMDKEGGIHKVDGLKKDEVYTVIGTPFGSPLIRYDQKDNLKVVDIRDDGMPIFEFESRQDSMIEIADYFRVNEGIAFRMLYRAGLKNSTNWAVTKKVEPREKLLLLMEKDWEFSKKEAVKRIYDSLYELNEDFRGYIADFNIRQPDEVIEVEYLKKGTFKRYSMKRMKGDVPIGQYKSPKIISSEKKEIVNELREV